MNDQILSREERENPFRLDGIESIEKLRVSCPRCYTGFAVDAPPIMVMASCMPITCATCNFTAHVAFNEILATEWHRMVRAAKAPHPSEGGTAWDGKISVSDLSGQIIPSQIFRTAAAGPIYRSPGNTAIERSNRLADKLVRETPVGQDAAGLNGQIKALEAFFKRIGVVVVTQEFFEEQVREPVYAVNTGRQPDRFAIESATCHILNTEPTLSLYRGIPQGLMARLVYDVIQELNAPAPIDVKYNQKLEIDSDFKLREPFSLELEAELIQACPTTQWPKEFLERVRLKTDRERREDQAAAGDAKKSGV
jgi:hypothetical protein